MRWGRLFSLAADAYGSLLLIAVGGLLGGLVAGLIALIAAPSWLDVSRGVGWSLGVAIATFGVTTGRLRFYGDQWQTRRSLEGSMATRTAGSSAPPPRKIIRWTRTLSTLSFLSGIGALLGGVASCIVPLLWGSLLMSPLSQSVLRWERFVSGQPAQAIPESMTAPLPSLSTPGGLRAVFAPLSQSTWQLPLLLVATVIVSAAFAGLVLGIYADRCERQTAAAQRQHYDPNRPESA